MNYTIEQLKGEVKINFTLTQDEWEAKLNGSYAKNKSKFNIPGFRKGHASRKMIERMYGEMVFFDDAFEAAFYEAYSKALSEHVEIEPVADPDVDIDNVGDGIAFHATVTVRPEVTLGEYKGMKIDKIEYNVTAADVEAEIDAARKRAGRNVEVTERAVMDGDTANIDYSGSVDGVKFDGGTATGQDLVIGSGSFIPGFEAQVEGMKIGETKDINVTFPTEYHAADLAGKAAVFTVTVNKITATEMPEFNDEFVKEVSEFNTTDEYKADVEKRLAETNERRANNETERALVDKIVNGATVEIPEKMVDAEAEYRVRSMEQQISQMYGMKFEDYLKIISSTRDQVKENLKTNAKDDLKVRLVLEAVIKAENLEVTEADIDAEIAKLAETAGKTVEEYKKTLDERIVNNVANTIINTKLFTFLKENNTFEKKAD